MEKILFWWDKSRILSGQVKPILTAQLEPIGAQDLFHITRSLNLQS